MKKKVIFIAPHLSTGGMPQYLFKQIESIIDDVDVYCIEWDNVTGGVLVVQRNKISNILGEKLITLGENKNELFEILNKLQPDIIHLQEIPELFMEPYIADKLYSTNRSYVIIETSHDSTFEVQYKQYLPDKFLFVSQYHVSQYAHLNIPYAVVPYPIVKQIRTKTREQALLALGLDPRKKHVINVGLFTPNKNQAEVIEYARILQHHSIQFHFIGNQADNFREYWEPLMQNFPSNCTWWNERSDVDTFYQIADLFLFTSKLELMPLVVRESVGWEIPSLIYNLSSYKREFDRYPTIEYLTDNIQLNAQRIIEKLFHNKCTMKDNLIHEYMSTEQLENLILPNIQFNSIDGMFVEILGGNSSHEYTVDFIRQDTNEVVYSTILRQNTWAKTNIKYFVNWKILVTNKTTGQTQTIVQDLKRKRVFITFESKALGDTLAWFPYVEEFRKYYDCEVICSTFWNTFFKESYPHITFVEPGTEVQNLYGLYRIGLFYNDDQIDYNRHPSPPLKGPLQKISSDILGLPYKEIKPIISHPNIEVNKNQISIAIHSTTQAKYWNNSSAWQTVVDWLNAKGYVVKLLSTEPDGYMGNKNPTGVIQHPTGPIEEVINELKKSRLFIGLGSGLSWLSWGLSVPTVLISGFSYDWAEMNDCIRITAPQGKCSGCFNRHRLNPGDWNWCPDHKGTPRQFECSKNITAEMVIQKLEKIL